MKEKIKKTILYLSIIYSIIVIGMMFINRFSLTSSIELSLNEKDNYIIDKYALEIKLMEQTECTDTIKEMINFYKKTTYNGKVNLKEMYNYNIENSYLSLYSKASKNCNLTEEEKEKNNLSAEVLTVVMQEEKIIQQYIYQYELSIKDIYIRNINEPYLENTIYNIRKKMEKEVIKNLIEITKEKEGDIKNEQ